MPAQSVSSGQRPYSARMAAALGAVALAVAPAPAQAWGPEGHRIVGRVAEQLLDERTRSALRELSRDENLAELG